MTTMNNPDSSTNTYHDTSFDTLLPYLSASDVCTLWVADENALHVLKQLPIQKTTRLFLLTNRYDIFTTAKEKNINATFNDFDFSQLDIPDDLLVTRVIYRISKEKAVAHHIFYETNQLLSKTVSSTIKNKKIPELVISGKKQEGIKSYQKHLIQTYQCQGQLKKNGTNYHGIFSGFRLTEEQEKSTPKTATPANISTYHNIHTIDADENNRNEEITTPKKAYTKAGIFGWNKIDKGSELLLRSLSGIMASMTPKPQSILDLGCGYGWIFLNLPHYLHTTTSTHLSITATDNNAAAILCAQKNSIDLPFSVHVIADDCAKNIKERFDLILCNPPFHQGFSHDKSLTLKFLEQTKKHLKTNGMAIFVVNEFIQLPYNDWFSSQKVIVKEQGFKVLTLS
ncbi:class I SAM-dependent methyltransferase [Eionea flava]